MKRRTFTAAATGVLAGLAGCLNQGANGGETTEPGDAIGTATSTSAGTSGSETGTRADSTLPAEEDGYPETVESKPEDREIDTTGLDTVTEGGVDVPLLPVEDAHVLWAYRRARFADARGEDQWENAHVVGAVSSPASPDARSDDDPIQDWGTSDTIICYCGCPHHLSSIRASQLINEGYENVFVIDEGFYEWSNRGYPVTSDGGGIEEFTVRGQLDASYAGENAWVQPLDSEQFESTNVADDGSFELHCKFVDVDATSRLRVDTPAWTRTGTVDDLTDGVLRGP
jgi:rhodanese-related sulfurtransferase